MNQTPRFDRVTALAATLAAGLAAAALLLLVLSRAPAVEARGLGQSAPSAPVAGSRAPTLPNVPSIDLVVTKYAPAEADPSGTVTFTILITNTGQDPANNVILTDTLPALTQYVGDSEGGYDTVDGADYVWPLLDLDPGASYAISVTVAVTSAVSAGDQFVNTARVSADEAEAEPADNVAQTVTVIAGANPYVLKSGPDLLPWNQLVSYTLVYGNSGPSAAVSVTLTEIGRAHV